MAGQVRRLTARDAQAFRDIRLEAVERHPESFAVSYEREIERPQEAFVEMIADNAIFGGFGEGELVGFAGFRPQSHPKLSHRGNLWGMYVKDRARGSGLAQDIAKALIDHARAHVDWLELSVTRENERARRFYEALGFETYGLQRDGLRLDGRSYDLELRAKALTATAR